MKLQSKNVLITGASSGIGRAFALKCANDGCNIFLASRSKEKLEEVKALVEERGSTAVVVPTDVTKAEEVKELFLEATKDGRTLDVVFNNAGLGHIANIYEQTVEEIESMVDVNVKGVLYVAKYASEVMVKQQHGHLILTSSLAGLITVPGWATYVATKWAITGFTDSIRMELKKFNIKVSSLHPGLVKTEFFEKEKANMSEEELDQQNAVTPEEVADAVYEALFTNKHKILVPSMVKSYSFINKYLPSVAEKLIEVTSKDLEGEPREEDEPEFSYISKVK
jgi:short-subunit dehydrogenase